MRKPHAMIGLVLTAAVLTLAGCNTIRGVGKDIHDTAQNVQMALEDSNENYAHIPPAEVNSRTAYYSARP